MSISEYSLAMAILWSNLCVIVVYVFRRNNWFIQNFTLVPLLVGVALSVFRLLFSFEFPFVRVIQSEEILPPVRSALAHHIFPWLIVSGLLICIWILISCILAVAVIRENWGFRKLLNKHPNTKEQNVLEAYCLTGGSPDIKLIKTKACKSPKVSGIRKPVIMLPDIELETWEWEIILQHELTHIRKKDLLFKNLLIAIFILFWWNIPLYLLLKEFDYIIELQCDHAVTADMDEKSREEYTATMIKILKTCGSEKPQLYSIAFAGSENKQSLYQRFDFIHKPIQKSKRKAAAVCVPLIIMFLVSYLFVVQPAGYPAETEIEGTYDIVAENSYFVYHKDEDNYSLYIDGEFVAMLEDFHESLEHIPIIFEEEIK